MRRTDDSAASGNTPAGVASRSSDSSFCARLSSLSLRRTVIGISRPSRSVNPMPSGTPSRRMMFNAGSTWSGSKPNACIAWRSGDTRNSG